MSYPAWVGPCHYKMMQLLDGKSQNKACTSLCELLVGVIPKRSPKPLRIFTFLGYHNNYQVRPCWWSIKKLISNWLETSSLLADFMGLKVFFRLLGEGPSVVLPTLNSKGCQARCTNWSDRRRPMVGAINWFLGGFETGYFILSKNTWLC